MISQEFLNYNAFTNRQTLYSYTQPYGRGYLEKYYNHPLQTQLIVEYCKCSQNGTFLYDPSEGLKNKMHNSIIELIFQIVNDLKCVIVSLIK